MRVRHLHIWEKLLSILVICFMYACQKPDLLGDKDDFEKDTDLPMFFRACSFNFGDFTGEGFVTPSDEGKLVYRKLLAQIGANIIGTQEDIEYYGSTINGGIGDEDIKSSIFPMYVFYTRKGNFIYNYKGFASDYVIKDVEQIYFATDYPYNHPWFLKGILKIRNKEILVLSFHFDWSDNTVRNAQIDQLIEYTKNYKYVLAMGDTNSLNAVDGVYQKEDVLRYAIEWQKFKDAGYELANNGDFGVFPTTYKKNPIDNIFVKGGKIKKAYTIQEDWMRDHLPIIADVVYFSSK